ncbi:MULTISPECIES: helix-turn-helix domain-containing protein [unclassified Corynebacterium]|uniref:helix-turn-helix domain-containing protein n=1 Tax=unclassified Corynebacterium TaxID=2624378 RepID=UPI0029CA9F16|nr:MULTISPECIES: helix-turn-helix domain-containing protein [unclassified Corynebacterium]WPF65997.1 helix-turn-helix domain-containing protein [Corynebacterium sp. 22KM0430]WPF68490.1 helix-turn-helix domain-containing protein [Corynebacterium sp. 21KM1197]
MNITIEHSEDIIEVSRDVADSLRILLINAVAGKTVSIIPTSAELTTQQAATLLNVSRPHVVKLIEQGILPGHRVGSHRRLYATDVQKYKDERDDVSRTAMNELIELSEELGLYE